MAHYHYFGALVYQFADCIRYDSGFYPCPFFQLPCLTAEEAEAVPVFYYHLVPASAKGYINGRPCKIEVFQECFPVYAEPQAECNRYLISDANFLYGIQHLEFLLFKLFEVLMLKDGQIFIPFKLPDYSAGDAHPLGHFFINLSQHLRPADILQALHQVVVVVNHNQADGHLFIVIPLLYLRKLGIVHQIEQQDEFVNIISSPHLGKIAEHAIVPAIDSYFLRNIRRFIYKLAGMEFFYKRAYGLLQKVFSLENFPEGRVIPDDCPIQLHHHQGHGKIQECVLGCSVYVEG